MTLSSSIIFYLDQKNSVSHIPNNSNQGFSQLNESKIAFQHRLLLTIHFTTNNLRLIKKYRKTFFVNNDKHSKKDPVGKFISKYNGPGPSGQSSNMQYPSKNVLNQQQKPSLSAESQSQISQSNSSLSSAPSSFKTINGSRWKWYEKLEKHLHQWVGKLIAYSLYHLKISQHDSQDKTQVPNDTNKDFSFELLFFNQLFPFSVVKTEDHEYEFIVIKDVANDSSTEESNDSSHRLAHLKKIIDEALPALKILLSYLGSTTYFMSFYYHYLFINIYHLEQFDCSKFHGFPLLQRYIGSKLDADFVAIMKRNGGNHSLNAENAMNAVATSAAGTNSSATQDQAFETDELLEYVAVKLKELQENNLHYYNTNPSFFAQTLATYSQTNDFLLIPGFKKFILFPSESNKFLRKSEQYPFDIFDELLEKLKSNTAEVSASTGYKGNSADKLLPPIPDAKGASDTNNTTNSLGTMLSFLSFTKAANPSSSTQPPPVPDKIGVVGNTKKRLPSPPELKLYRQHYQAHLENPISVFQNVSIFTKSSAITGVKTPIQMVMQANHKWGVSSNMSNSASQTSLSFSKNSNSQKNFDKKPLPAINKTVDKSRKNSPPPPPPPKAYFPSNNVAGMSNDSYMEFTQFMKSDTLLDNFKFDTLSSLPNFESSAELISDSSTEYIDPSKQNSVSVFEEKASNTAKILKNELYLHKEFFGPEFEHQNVPSIKGEENLPPNRHQTDVLLRTKICQSRKLVATLNQTLEEYWRILPAERNVPTFILYNTPQRKNAVMLPTV
ncbi:hypothetical protein ACO0QE_001882 [Hanseniaspora vineae]